MPAYNFKIQFAPAVKSGQKICTIRRRRKRPTVKGDKLFLYTGTRSKFCIALKNTTCKKVTPLELIGNQLYINDLPASDVQVEILAQRDGFNSAADFFGFFRATYGEGDINDLELIEW